MVIIVITQTIEFDLPRGGFDRKLNPLEAFESPLLKNWIPKIY